MATALATFCQVDVLYPAFTSLKVQDGTHQWRELPVRASILAARARAVSAFVRGESMRVAYMNSPSIHRELRRLVLADDAYEVVIFKRKRMGQFRGVVGGSRLTVLDLTDSVALWEARIVASQAPFKSRLLAAADLAGTVREEVRLLLEGHFDQVWVSSHVDVDFLTCLSGRSLPQLCVVPNVVPQDVFVDHSQSRVADRLVFFGDFRQPTNSEALTWFANDIWPIIRRQRPEAECWIVGYGSDRFTIKCSGLVPHGFASQLRDVVSPAWASVAPLRSGAGMKNKVLQSLAMGVPVVATAIALEGIGKGDKRVPGTWDGGFQASSFAQAALAALAVDPDERDREGDAGKSYIREHFSADALQRQLKLLVGGHGC
jgi:glycosyltransferase involved in cell wall biosynthesis